MNGPTQLTNTEKAYFDTIKQVTRSARPEDLALRRMLLLDAERPTITVPREVAVIVQRILSSDDATTVGYQPLAVLLDDDTALRLRDVDGSAPESVDPEGLEGSA